MRPGPDEERSRDSSCPFKKSYVMRPERFKTINQKALLLALLGLSSVAASGCTAVVVGAAAGAAAGYAVSELTDDDNNNNKD